MWLVGSAVKGLLRLNCRAYAYGGARPLCSKWFLSLELTMDHAGDIVVINLAERTDRRSEMEIELKRVNWSAQFFRAIRPKEKGQFPSVGSKGCFLSHLAVLKLARDHHLNRLIILEDDVTFAADFVRRWPKALTELESLDWSIFYPGHALGETSPGVR